MTSPPHRIALPLLAGLALAACSPAPGPEPASKPAGEPASASSGTATTSTSAPQETAGPTPRLVATYDGGLLTLDSASLEVIADTPLPGFNRINQLGDGRSLLVSTAEGFRLFDTGAWTEPHGDHTHSYTASPRLTDITYPAQKPGHVVNEGTRTLLFGDGDGSIQEIDLSSLALSTDAARTYNVTPHHGVAVPLDDVTLLRTEGTSDERHTVLAQDSSGAEIARAENCPGVHGEAVAAGAAVTFGCEDGILIYKDAAFTKLSSPDGYGRIGNQAGSRESSVVLGDYKVDRDAELERPTRVSLTDTVSGTLSLVDVEASYSFRSLGRGPGGEALVLGTDGNLRVIDPTSGEVTATIPVVAPWEESTTWQDPRPTLFVQGGYAYVTEPATNSIHKVELATGEVSASAELPHTPNELNGVEG